MECTFIIYDKISKKIHIFNDPQGEKIYFFNNDEYFIISSTPEPILKIMPNCKYNIDSLRIIF